MYLDLQYLNYKVSLHFKSLKISNMPKIIFSKSFNCYDSRWKKKSFLEKKLFRFRALYCTTDFNHLKTCCPLLLTFANSWINCHWNLPIFIFKEWEKNVWLESTFEDLLSPHVFQFCSTTDMCIKCHTLWKKHNLIFSFLKML